MLCKNCIQSPSEIALRGWSLGVLPEQWLQVCALWVHSDPSPHAPLFPSSSAAPARATLPSNPIWAAGKCCV